MPFSLFAHVRACFWESARSLRKTETLTITGLFLAIQIVLSSFGVLQLSDSLKISLAHLAMVPTAMLAGPIPAIMQGALSDILGFLLKPTGPYFPGFTISAALLGLVYGLFFYRTKANLWQLIAARLIVIVFINICLNTVFLAMLYGPSYYATLPVRAMKNIIQLPFDVVLLLAMTQLVCRLQPIVSRR